MVSRHGLRLPLTRPSVRTAPGFPVSLVQLRRPTALSPAPAAEGAPRLAYVETYGCQMNVADTEMVLGMLHRSGFARTLDAMQADLILINTCAIRENAESRVWARASILAQAKIGRPGVVMGITGCMAEHLKEKIQEKAPYVDLVVGPDGYRRLIEHVERARAGEPVHDTALDRCETYEGLDPSREMTASTTGHITIQRGCDKFCTFCVVPYTRGRERGIPPREILRQARAMAAAGYREVQLLGQTVNSYRWEDVTFADLLRGVAAVDGLARVRFMSPYPLDFSDEAIAAIAETASISKQVHLPMQSASDVILDRMRRGYTFAQYRQLVDRLRAAIPDLAITTDLIIGFCDETEEDLNATLAALEEIRFDGSFNFAYSERAGTVAARKLPDTVPETTKNERLARVIEVQRRITAEILAAQIGKRERVLFEGTSRRREDEFLGRTDAGRMVVVPAAQGVGPGAMCDVVIERSTGATLIGRAVGAPA